MKKFVPELFNNICDSFSDQPAIWSTSNDSQITYKELSLLAHELSCHLSGLNLRPNREQPHAAGTHETVRIAILLPPGAGAVVAMLGTLLAGYAFVPLNIATIHLSRTDEILEHVEPQAIITHARYLENKAIAHQRKRNTSIVCLTDELKPKFLSSLSAVSQCTTITAKQLAYIVYSSGTEGNPKGIMVGHGGFANVITANIKKLEIKQGDKVAQGLPLSFDAAIMEIFTALLAGGCLYIMANKEDYVDYTHIIPLYNQYQIDFAIVTPSFLAFLNPSDIDHRMKLTYTGEKTPERLINKCFGRGSPLEGSDGWGPSELPIAGTINGDALDGLRISIWKENPEDDKGEIIVSGEDLGLGYWKDASKTQQSFLDENPATGVAERCYRTGDLGYLDASGKLHIVGRIGEQVKIGGKLVTPEEVAVKIDKYPSNGNILSSTVVGIASQDGNTTHLQAYLVTKPGYMPPIVEIQAYLSRDFEFYKIPTTWCTGNEQYYTANRKTDFQKIKSLPGKRYPGYQPLQESAEHSDIILIWKKYLKIESTEGICADDNFFYWGGSSLDAAGLIHAINQLPNGEISLPDFMQTPTLGYLIRRKLWSLHKGKITEKLFINFNQQRNGTPVICLPTMFGDTASDYAVLAGECQHMSTPFAGLQSLGLEFPELMPDNNTELAAFYINIITDKYPQIKQGHCLLIGWSGGGITGLAMKKQLKALGTQVKLIMLDTTAPEKFQQLDEVAFRAFFLALLTDDANGRNPLENYLLKGDLDPLEGTKYEKFKELLFKPVVASDLPQYWGQSKQFIINNFFDRLSKIFPSKKGLLTTLKMTLLGGLRFFLNEVQSEVIVVAAGLTQQAEGERLGWSEQHDIRFIRIPNAGHNFITKSEFIKQHKLVRLIEATRTLTESARLISEIKLLYLSERADCHLPEQMAENFVDLLLEEKRTHRDRMPSFKPTSNKKEDQSGSFEVTTYIDLSAIFSSMTPRRTVLITGSAGMGKTMLVTEIAKRWARGVLWPEFVLVLLIKFKNIPDEKFNSEHLFDFLSFNHIVKSTELNYSSKKIVNLLRLLGEQALVIFDGFDEIKPEKKEIFHQIMANFSAQGFQCKMIITSRPLTTPAMSFDYQIESQGFSASEIESFCHQLSAENGNLLKESIAKNQALLEIARTPINLRFISAAFTGSQMDLIDDDGFLSITDIYQRLTLQLLKTAAKKPGIEAIKALSPISIDEEQEIEEVFSEPISLLSDMAYFGNKQSFSLFEIKFLRERKYNVNLFREVLQLGFLNTHGDFLTNKDSNTYFHHGTVQDFFAAKFWVKRFESNDPIDKEKALKFLRENKYDQQKETFWVFAVGLLNHRFQTCTKKQRSQALKNIDDFFYHLQAEPIDLIGVYSNLLLIRCLNEISDPDRIEGFNGIIEKFISILNMYMQKGEKLSVGQAPALEKIAMTLRASPKIFELPSIVSNFIALLTDTELSSATLAVLSHIKTYNSEIASHLILQMPIPESSHVDTVHFYNYAATLIHMGERPVIIFNMLIDYMRRIHDIELTYDDNLVEGGRFVLFKLISLLDLDPGIIYPVLFQLIHNCKAGYKDNSSEFRVIALQSETKVEMAKIFLSSKLEKEAMRYLIDILNDSKRIAAEKMTALYIFTVTKKPFSAHEIKERFYSLLQGGNYTPLREVERLEYKKTTYSTHSLYDAVALYLRQDVAELKEKVIGAMDYSIRSPDGVVIGQMNYMSVAFHGVLPDLESMENYISNLLDGGYKSDPHVDMAVLMKVLKRPIVAVGSNGRIQNKEIYMKELRQIDHSRNERIFVYCNDDGHYDALLMENFNSGLTTTVVHDVLKFDRDSQILDETISFLKCFLNENHEPSYSREELSQSFSQFIDNFNFTEEERELYELSIKQLFSFWLRDHQIYENEPKAERFFASLFMSSYILAAQHIMSEAKFFPSEVIFIALSYLFELDSDEYTHFNDGLVSTLSAFNFALNDLYLKKLDALLHQRIGFSGLLKSTSMTDMLSFYRKTDVIEGGFLISYKCHSEAVSAVLSAGKMHFFTANGKTSLPCAISEEIFCADSSEKRGPLVKNFLEAISFHGKSSRTFFVREAKVDEDTPAFKNFIADYSYSKSQGGSYEIALNSLSNLEKENLAGYLILDPVPLLRLLERLDISLVIFDGHGCALHQKRIYLPVFYAYMRAHIYQLMAKKCNDLPDRNVAWLANLNFAIALDVLEEKRALDPLEYHPESRYLNYFISELHETKGFPRPIMLHHFLPSDSQVESLSLEKRNLDSFLRLYYPEKYVSAILDMIDECNNQVPEAAPVERPDGTYSTAHETCSSDHAVCGVLTSVAEVSTNTEETPPLPAPVAHWLTKFGADLRIPTQETPQADQNESSSSTFSLSKP